MRNEPGAYLKSYTGESSFGEHREIRIKSLRKYSCSLSNSIFETLTEVSNLSYAKSLMYKGLC